MNSASVELGKNTPKKHGAEFVAGCQLPELGDELLNQLKDAVDLFAALEKK